MDDELVDQASKNLTKAVCDVFGLLDHSAEAICSDNFLKVSNQCVYRKVSSFSYF